MFIMKKRCCKLFECVEAAEVVKFPKVIRIEPSSTCNLNCIHCPTGTINMGRGLMSEGIFTQILDSIKPYLSTIEVVVLYHGGEPLLNQGFEKMVSELKKTTKAKIKTVTNGMLLNTKRIEGIINAGLDEIEISLDGLNSEENNYIRKGCDFDKVAKNAHLLIEIKRNRKSKMPVVHISTTQFLEKKDQNYQLKNESISIPQYLLEEFRSEIRAQEIESIKSTYAMRWPDMKIDHKLIDEIIITDNDAVDHNYCDHVMNTLTIRYNGDVVPCCYDLTSKLVMGNVQNQRLDQIWNSSKYQALRNSICEMKFGDLCNNCNVVKNRKKVLLTLKNEKSE